MLLCRVLIALGVFIVFAACALAQEVNSRTGDPALGLRLKMQPALSPGRTPGPNEDLPVFIEADRIEGTQDREIKASGDVVMRRLGEAVFADRLSYVLPTSKVTAVGHVRFDRLGDEVSGDTAEFDMNNNSGVMEQPTFKMRQIHARGQAERLLIRDRDRYRGVRATYTNCDVGDDDWFMKMQRLDIDRLTSIGDGRNVTLYFKHLPILYTPWIQFPTSNRRKSGLLAPSYGSTAKSGFEIMTPIYWNIAPTMDYTFAPRIMSRRGVLLGNEFRYLQPHYSGEIKLDYLPDDRIKGERRYWMSLQHAQNFGGGLTGSLNLQRVSDDAYFTDLSDRIAVTAQSVLPQEAQLRYEGNWWSAQVRSQRYQTLQDPLAPIVPPYSRLPQVSVLGSQQNVFGFDLGANGEFVNFDHPTLLNGRRQIYYPSVSYPYRTPNFYITPKIGLSYTKYLFPTETQIDGETRSLPIFSLDSGTSFERDIKLGGRDMVQTLEPRIYYLRIPYRNQIGLPVFDTALKDFNFASIFSENKFSGGDRINDADQVTVAATTRLINPATGAEQWRALLGQRYYFKPQLVTLESTLPTGQPPPQTIVQPSDASRSDVLAAFSGAVTRSWSVDTGLEYGVNNGEIERYNVAVRNQPEAGKVLNLAYRYTRNFIEQVDLSAQWPLSRRWGLLGRLNYSLRDQTLIEGLAGLEYTAGCWTARFVIHRFVTNTLEQSNSFFFQLELTGLSRIGTSPLELLRQGIGGYTQPNLRPISSGAYYPGTDTP